MVLRTKTMKKSKITIVVYSMFKTTPIFNLKRSPKYKRRTRAKHEALNTKIFDELWN